ncbi:MAG: endonuclease/exonuclease/phosphatase family protein [Pseudomonadota bacterium]
MRALTLRHMRDQSQPETTAIDRPADDFRLRVLSYNIQVGLHTAHYGHYLTRVWRHALPGPGMHRNLDRIAELLRDYDFVALQEADAGSLRTQFTNQVQYLAQRAGFAHWGLSVTRDLRPVACHALAYLSRFAPQQVSEHVLPSRLPGRHALSVQLGADAGGLQLLVTHLSLSGGAQRLQLDYLNRLVPDTGPVLLMGDLNCDAAALRRHALSSGSRLRVPEQTPLTFPSWQPRRSLDHILHTPELRLDQLRVLPHAVSDHLPLAAEVAFLRQ